MALTKEEKEEWKERISRKVDKAIEELIAAENPTFLQELKAEARKLALSKLGLLELDERCEKIRQMWREGHREMDELVCQMLSVLRGPTYDARDYYGASSELEDAIEQCAAAH